ncbi:MAG: M23 family metallopeptidase [Sphingomonas bacterium]|nr:M23 family metallopeptidase [Sphingomonas bacterium]
MLISPPFLLARAANESDEAWVNRCMDGGAPGDGAFPVSFKLGWHGGMHLFAPMNGTQPEAVRAIADGVVVFVRQPTAQPAGPLPPAHPQAYRGWTDNGVVVIRHATEIGEGAGAAVAFFSITMHLSAIEPAIRQGRAVYRKASLGTAGQIYGSTRRQIHLEIVCDGANLARLAGRASGDLPLTADGRTDAVYGEMYFHVPAGAQVFGQAPLPNHAQAMRQPAGNPAPPPAALPAVHTTAAALIVGLRYAGGEGAAANRGDAYLRTYGLDGTALGAALEENDAEYGLYTSATGISRSYPAASRPAPSAVYELLRFGRVIGPDALTPATVPHWRQVRYPGGQGWVNLNAANVRKFSDADLPHWKRWRLIDDAVGQDSRCDSVVIKGWLDVDNDGRVDLAEATARLSDATVAPKLARAVCKFATEWDAATIDARWGWLKTSTPENPQPLSAADFELLRAHITALAFWPGGMGIDAHHWHWQPREFVRQFRGCGWLSEQEFERVYPNSQYPVTTLSQIDLTPEIIRERYRGQINWVAKKYFLFTPTRMTHFFGQGAVESLLLALMVEGAADFRRNPRHASFASEVNGYYNPAPGGYLDYLNGRLGNVSPGDGPKFRGRGMKQLTGRENYSKYWVYRGWLDKDSFTSPWWNPARPALAANIPNPQRLSTNEFSAVDAGGWYWEAGSTANRHRSINTVISDDDFSPAAIERVTRAINGGINGLAQRQTQTTRIRPILSDDD